MEDWPLLEAVSLSAFGEDYLGELYMLDVYGGEVYRIVPVE